MSEEKRTTQESAPAPAVANPEPDLSWICDPCKTPCYACEEIDACPMGGMCAHV